MRYRRDQAVGATYFFTTVTFQRALWLDNNVVIQNLREAFYAEMMCRPFIINAIVIMPDHIHAVWSLPEEDADCATRWRNIKRAFTASIPAKQRPTVSASRQHKGEQAIWQRRFWEHRIRDEQDLIQHIDYVHFNPVKHGYVSRPIDWPYSSIHRYIRKSILMQDWGCVSVDIPDKIGHE